MTMVGFSTDSDDIRVVYWARVPSGQRDEIGCSLIAPKTRCAEGFRGRDSSQEKVSEGPEEELANNAVILSSTEFAQSTTAV